MQADIVTKKYVDRQTDRHLQEKRCKVLTLFSTRTEKSQNLTPAMEDPGRLWCRSRA